MVWFATLLAHLLVLFLIVAVPLRGQRRYEALRRRLERRPESGTEERLKFYKNGILGQWLMMIPLAVIIFGLGWSPQKLGLQAPSNVFLSLLIALILVLAFYGQVFYIRRIANSAEGREQLRQSMSGPLLLLPRVAKERVLWIPLSLTAGLCEELLFRGFLPAYLMYIFPGVPLILAIFIAAILFGIGHIYQKLTGVLGTGLMGLIFGFLYFFTGSLFLPMIVHALFDLRLILLDVPGLVDTPEKGVEAAPLPS